MREIWLAEDEALQQIFNKVNDSEFNQSIEAMAGRFFKSFKKRRLYGNRPWSEWVLGIR